MTKTIQGAAVKVFINGQLWGAVQEISWTLDYSEQELYGIDSPFPQEIHGVKTSAYGSIKGLRIRQSNGLQGIQARPVIHEVLSSPYISIRVQDRFSGEDLVFFPRAKVASETHSVPAKGILSVSFQFRAMAGWQPMDRT